MSTTGRLRDYRTELAFLHRADGSCHLSAGSTVLWASVNGPGDAPSSKKKHLSMTIEVACVPPAGDPAALGRLSRMLTSIIEKTVYGEFYPRAMLQVTVQQLQGVGNSELATAGWALTAAGLAILDSGVAARTPFCGVTVALGQDDVMLLDPDDKTAAKAKALMVFAFTREDKDTVKLIACETEGRAQLTQFLQAKDLAAKAALEIFQFYLSALQRKLTIDRK